MKKIQVMTICISYAIFAAIMIFSVFGRIYPNAMRTEPMYDFLNLFCIVSLVAFACILFVFKKPNKYILYLVIPYLISQLIQPYVLVKYEHYQFIKNSTGFQLFVDIYLLFYISTFIWLLSLFMLALDYGLNKRFKPID